VWVIDRTYPMQHATAHHSPRVVTCLCQPQESVCLCQDMPLQYLCAFNVKLMNTLVWMYNIVTFNGRGFNMTFHVVPSASPCLSYPCCRQDDFISGRDGVVVRSQRLKLPCLSTK
jgi:hypothetical protein